MFNFLKKYPPQIYNKVYKITLAISIALLPWNSKFNTVSIIFLCTFWLLEGKWGNKWIAIKNSKVLIFTLIYLIGITGLAYTENYQQAFSYLEVTLSLLVFPIVLSSIPRFSTKDIHFILWCFIISCGIFTTYAFIKTITIYQQEETIVSLKLFNLHFNKTIHAIFFSIFLIFCCFSLVHLISFHRKNIKIRSIAFIGFLIILIFSIILSARSPIFASILITLGALIIYTFKKPTIRKSLVFTTTLLLLALSLFFYIQIPGNRIKNLMVDINNYMTYYNQPEEKKYHHTSVTRFIIWKNCWDVIKDQNIYFGNGTGDVHNALVAQYRKNKELWWFDKFNTHNQYIDYLMRYGIVGLAIFIFMLGFPLYKSIQHKNYLYISFILLIAICCLTENVLQRQWGVVFYGFFNSLFAFHTTINISNVSSGSKEL